MPDLLELVGELELVGGELGSHGRHASGELLHAAVVGHCDGDGMVILGDVDLGSLVMEEEEARRWMVLKEFLGGFVVQTSEGGWLER